MQVTTATTRDGSPLRAVRGTLDHADEAILAVAFASEAGVHLLRQQLDALGPRTRLLVTTAFGTTTAGALQMARSCGADVRTLNPAGGTYHPKLYLARRRGGAASAVIGSANLTRGLVGNVEVGTTLRGTMDDAPLASAWAWAEQVWEDPRSELWAPPAEVVEPPTFDVALFAMLQAEVALNPLFLTLTHGRPNHVVEVTRSGMYVETEASMEKGRPPQLVPAWMIEMVWIALRTRGRISQQEVLADDGLNVRRSAAVCAVLARLPGVGVVREGRRTVLVWGGA